MRFRFFGALLIGLVIGQAAWADSLSSRYGDMPTPVRFATFNASLNRSNAGDLITDLSTPDNEQAQKIAEIIQRTQPDVLLINEFDYDEQGTAAQLLLNNYLAVSQNGATPVSYTYSFVAPANTGVQSGFDLDNDGAVGGPGDAFGFGFFPGQYGMVLYSRYPINPADIRTFQNFLWQDMPDALLPDDPNTAEPADWYAAEEKAVLRLSSKSHWDVPINVNGHVIHVLASHPTPPVFDGAEDRNGTRNHDEIRFWADYITPEQSAYIYDDEDDPAQPSGGLAPEASFVIMGDLNADPFDGDSTNNAVNQLLDHQRVNTSVTPASLGGPEQALLQGEANAQHQGNPAYDTADFNDAASGNLRADYVLPSTDLSIVDAEVFWPLSTDPLYDLVLASDHRLVWVDVVPQSTSTQQVYLPYIAR